MKQINHSLDRSVKLTKSSAGLKKQKVTDYQSGIKDYLSQTDSIDNRKNS